jgi:hypothetical protein
MSIALEYGVDRLPNHFAIALTGKQGLAVLEGLMLFANKYQLNDVNYAASRSAFIAVIRAMQAAREIETEPAQS